MLCSAGFGAVWLHQGVGNENGFVLEFKQRLIDMSTQEWYATVDNRDRYMYYRSFKCLFELELYVKVSIRHHLRSAYSMLRAGMLPVNANRFRYNNDVQLQFCPVCSNSIEDEHHILFVCPLYTEERNKLNSKISLQNFDGNYTGIMRRQNKLRVVSISAYIHKVLQIRAKFMEMV